MHSLLGLGSLVGIRRRESDFLLLGPAGEINLQILAALNPLGQLEFLGFPSSLLIWLKFNPKLYISHSLLQVV